jgi:hypothetical protein
MTIKKEPPPKLKPALGEARREQNTVKKTANVYALISTLGVAETG